MPILTDLVFSRVLLAGMLPVAATLSWVATMGWPMSHGSESPPVVSISNKTVQYRMPGEFRSGTALVDGPMATISTQRAFDIMTFEVSLADYQACVSDAACDSANASPSSIPDGPVTGVSFVDAEKYARWLSSETGESWRLPTDEEWALAAGSRYSDDAIGVLDDPANPSVRWLAKYRLEIRLNATPNPEIRKAAHYGYNENGVADMSGNVWEWTTSCYVRASLQADGSIASRDENCGVRVIEGKHRSFMTEFLRDGVSGGCSTGSPPDHLGFRLVRDVAQAA